MKLYILFQSNLKSATGKGSNILIGDIESREYKAGEIIDVYINKTLYKTEILEQTKDLVKGKLYNKSKATESIAVETTSLSTK